MKKYSSEGKCKTSFVSQNGIFCKFDELSSALFPKVDFKTLTKGVLSEPSKISVTKLTVNNCKKRNRIEYEMATVEAAETIRYLVLSSGTNLYMRFNYNNFINQDKDNWENKYFLACDGFTDVGKDNICKLKCTKSFKDDDVGIAIEKSPIFAKDFFGKFHIGPQQLLPKDKDEVRKALSLDSLKFDDAVFKGTLSDEGLIEFYATGKPSGSKFLGSEVYLIAQNSGDANDKVTMLGGILSKFKKEEFPEKLQAILGEPPSEELLSAPILDKRNNEMYIAITAEDIPLIYSDEVVKKFEDSVVPSSGGYLKAGCTIRYKIEKGYQTFSMSTQEEKKDDDLLVCLDVDKNKFTFSCPDKVSIEYSSLSKLLNPAGKVSECDLKGTEKVKFVKAVVEQSGKTINMDIFCSPSSEIEVIGNGILTLTNTTFKVSKDPKGKWLLYGDGEESIMQQLANITIAPNPQTCGSVLTGEANIYNMDILSDRAGAEYLSKKYGDSFNHTRSFTIRNMRYVASFKNSDALR